MTSNQDQTTQDDPAVDEPPQTVTIWLMSTGHVGDDPIVIGPDDPAVVSMNSTGVRIVRPGKVTVFPTHRIDRVVTTWEVQS